MAAANPFGGSYGPQVTGAAASPFGTSNGFGAAASNPFSSPPAASGGKLIWSVVMGMQRGISSLSAGRTFCSNLLLHCDAFKRLLQPGSGLTDDKPRLKGLADLYLEAALSSLHGLSCLPTSIPFPTAAVLPHTAGAIVPNRLASDPLNGLTAELFAKPPSGGQPVRPGNA